MSSTRRSRPTLADAIVPCLVGSVEAVVTREPGVVAWGDPEDVHQYRVALRRLRSDLRTLAPVLDPAWARPIDHEIRELAALVGEVRDADVLAARLDARIGELPPADQVTAHRLTAHLDNHLAHATERLLATLATDDHRRFIERLALAAGQPAFATDPRPGRGPDDRAAPVLAALVRRQWRRLRIEVEQLPAPVTDDHLHRVRILAKRVRYASELAERAWGREARPFAAAMAEVQQVLGDVQDSVLTERWLRAAAPAVPTAATCAGMLIALEWPHQAAGRAAFPAVWARSSRRELRTWLGDRAK